MAGTSIEPNAEVSATAEPESPANNIEDKMFTCARPPRRCPIIACANSTKRAVMPPLFINSPASIKNGIAISGKLSIPL